MPQTSVLLVEDDDSLGFVIKDNLALKGYAVTWCQNGNTGAETFKEMHPDICLLDVMLPGKDGFTLAKYIKETSPDTPFLFLTAKSMIEDKLEGFKIGADDYITKPFHVEELVFRIEACLKRKRPHTKNTSLVEIGSFQFDSHTLSLTHAQCSISLTFKEGEILKLLYDQRHRIVKREEILNHVWGNDDYFNGRSMDVFIFKLRKYLNHDPSLRIVNYHGIGFRLEGDSLF